MRIYIELLEGEPLHAYSTIVPIRKDFDKWVDSHMYYLTDDFTYYIEQEVGARELTDKQEDSYWHAFLDDMFETGTWGDYAWYECFLD